MKTIKNILIFVILVVVISSCSTSNNVVSSGLIQKRKYKKGFYLNSIAKNPGWGKNQSKQKKVVNINEKVKESSERGVVASKEKEEERSEKELSVSRDVEEQVILSVDAHAGEVQNDFFLVLGVDKEIGSEFREEYSIKQSNINKTFSGREGVSNVVGGVLEELVILILKVASLISISALVYWILYSAALSVGAWIILLFVLPVLGYVIYMLKGLGKYGKNWWDEMEDDDSAYTSEGYRFFFMCALMSLVPVVVAIVVAVVLKVSFVAAVGITSSSIILGVFVVGLVVYVLSIIAYLLYLLLEPWIDTIKRIRGSGK